MLGSQAFLVTEILVPSLALQSYLFGSRSDSVWASESRSVLRRPPVIVLDCAKIQRLQLPSARVSVQVLWLAWQLDYSWAVMLGRSLVSQLLLAVQLVRN